MFACEFEHPRQTLFAVTLKIVGRCSRFVGSDTRIVDAALSNGSEGLFDVLRRVSGTLTQEQLEAIGRDSDAAVFGRQGFGFTVVSPNLTELFADLERPLDEGQFFDVSQRNFTRISEEIDFRDQTTSALNPVALQPDVSEARDHFAEPIDFRCIGSYSLFEDYDHRFDCSPSPEWRQLLSRHRA